MFRKKGPSKPVENHKTAAWANIEAINQLSDTSHPSLQQAINAKEYVDENEK
jgi:hypothetical protein